MKRTIQEDSVIQVSEDGFNNAAASTSAVQVQSTIRLMTDKVSGTQPIRKFQPLRFAMGLLSTTAGMALILGVALRIFELRDVSSDFVMPLNGICVLFGVMLLGGGFGIMATSSSGFDEDEFDRLATAGNISAASVSKHSDKEFGDEQGPQHTAASV